MRAAPLALLTLLALLASGAIGCAAGRAPVAVAEEVADALALNLGGAWWDVDAGPLALWVQPRAGHVRAVLAAADAWDGVVRGLRFAPARDSASAAVVVVWRCTLGGTATRPTAGRTTLRFTRDGRAVDAVVELALRAVPGVPYTPADVRVFAQHELGHVLGLAHHRAASSVMAPSPAAGVRPSALDRRTLRLLYAMRR